MGRTQRIELLLRVAEEHERDAAHVLADHTIALQTSHDKLEQLLSYQTDYSKEFATNRGVGLSVQVQDHWLFLDRLNRAITEQSQHLGQREDTVEASKQRWQDAHKQCAILGKVAERIRQAHRTESDRRAQKWVDDLAGAAYARASKKN